MSRKRKRKEKTPKLASASGGGDSSKTPSRQKKSAPQPSGRVWLFRLLLALGAPIVVVAVIEIGLQQLDYGFPTDFFLASDDGTHWVENNQFAWQFYSPQSQLRPHPFRMPQKKEVETIRIFTLGESATLGTPESAYGFVRILERMFQLRFPNHRFEVVNAAMPGINSHLIRSIARDCALREPDAFVVYMGNNEMVGLHAPGPDSRGLTDKLWLLRLMQTVRSSRTGQLLSPLTAAMAPKQPKGEQDMAFFRDHRLAFDDPGRQAVVNNFRENLTDILDAINASGAGAVLSTVAVNLRECPPLGSLHGKNLNPNQTQEWDAAFQRGGNLWAQGDATKALTEYGLAAKIDGDHAELVYRMALCYEALGRVDEAKAAYERARDLDALPFRTVSALNDAIREVGTRRTGGRLRLIESDRLLGENVPDRVKLPGLETFYEHVHFRFAGDYQLAALFFSEVQQLLQARLGLSKGQIVEAPSLEECAAALAYNHVNEGLLESSIMDMTAHAPFLDQMNHDDRKEATRNRLKERYGSLGSEDVAEAFRIYQNAMESYPNDWNLAYLLSRLHFTFHNFEAARENLKRATELMPHVVEVRLGYTRALIETKQSDEAFRQIERLQAMAPESPEVAAALSTAKARQAADR